MSRTVDVHRCLAGSACRDAAELDGQRVGTLTAEPNTLCEPCRTRIVDATRQLHRDWRELRAALGEKSSGITETVHSTPTPAIPISITKDALMSQIVELADRAAAIVSDALETEQPDGRRPIPPEVVDPATGKMQILEAGSPAANAEEATRPDDEPRLTASIAIVEPHIDLLAQAPAQPFTIWETAGEDDQTPIQRDPETGDPIRGRGRVFVEMTGIDIALAITDIHNRTRAELGKTRLRHRYELPCPRCAGEVGRDDGTTIVDCKNEACKASWTEREFKFLQGLIVEGQETEIMKWLLTEAYTRLDTLAQASDIIRDNQFLDTDPAGGRTVLDIIDNTLKNHTPPRDREIATTKAAAKARQIDDDNWSWRNEKPYRPPKRKPTKPKPQPAQRYTVSSRTTLTDVTYLPDTNDRPARACGNCHMIHQGDCIA